MARISLPIETKSREFLGKTWLALHLVSEGHTVLIGDKGPIYSRCNEFEPHIFIEKSAFYSDTHASRMENVKHSGGNIVFLDEEGGVFNSKEKYIQTRSPELFQYFDRVFAWGEAPASAISEGTSIKKEEIIITGNPRFDLLLPNIRSVYESEADSISSKMGEFVLFNTNFSIGNHHSGDDPEQVFEGKNIKIKQRKHIDTELIDHFSSGISEFLSTASNVNVVIRPHPSENVSTYKELFSDERRVIVDGSGDVRPWILASQAVVHNSCTTGIESVLLNKPTISFQKKSLETSEYKSDLPNIVSDTVYTPEQLSAKLKDLPDQRDQLGKESRNQLKQYFHNIDEPAAPVIAEEITRLANTNEGVSYPDPKNKNIVDELKRSPLGSIVKTVYYQFNGVPTSQKKFPGLSKSELEAAVADFQDLHDFRAVTIKQAARWEDIYWMYPD